MVETYDGIRRDARAFWYPVVVMFVCKSSRSEMRAEEQCNERYSRRHGGLYSEM